MPATDACTQVRQRLSGRVVLLDVAASPIFNMFNHLMYLEQGVGVIAHSLIQYGHGSHPLPPIIHQFDRRRARHTRHGTHGTAHTHACAYTCTHARMGQGDAAADC